MDLSKSKRIVIKLGTQVVIGEDGLFAAGRIKNILKNMADLSPSREFLIVTSGAVGLGKQALKISDTKDVVKKQACAAVGQALLMNSYNKIINSYKKTAAQLLVTADDLTDRKKYLNFSRTLEELLDLKAIPIINENDSISTVELDGQSKSFGDNDKLSALVSSKMNVDLLVILTNVDGVFTENPNHSKNAKKVGTIESFEDLKRINTDGKSETGRGGLKTKLEAARIAQLNGVTTVIASGFEKNIVKKIIETKSWNSQSPGTLIRPETKISHRKNWIGFSTNTTGIIVVNEGAKTALLGKKASLLPIGIVSVKGEFRAGEVVSIQDESGAEVARGLTSLNSSDVKKIIGTKANEVIHRDNLVVYTDYQL